MQSNVTGEEIDIEKVCEIVEKRCKELNIPIPHIIVDGSQGITHKKIRLKELKNIYAFVFSGHKIYGPQGIRSIIFK